MPTCLYAAGRCSECGEPLRIDERRECSSIYVPPPQATTWGGLDCEHMLGANGETTLALGCRTCGGSEGVEVSVCDCELYGRCAPFGSGTHLKDKSIRRCCDCRPDLYRGVSTPPSPHASSSAGGPVASP